ncbi:LysR family transcriptional regulator [Parachitinimonas caeni]|uniref:LysR family transcriptional regulator n=1 Tax=Parachitinimonas caeni TaxID=3031301 RepID=A0ABT7DYX3_9NEIS|nr:LysR family transcriptional regulator [Parachitinimonas caeni]MDK2125252.1 LysR family transcriptional regulator [Parachitinimonas caeni]
MRRIIPSTRTLLAFEAAARHGSFSKAAEELALTHSAVCRQIATLEDTLGMQLFIRGKRGVTLSEAGQRYWRQVAADLDRIEQNVLDIMAQGGAGGVLELAVLPSMATHWLIPRLPDFYAHQPAITLNLSVRTKPFLFADTSFDAALHAGDPVWPGAECVYLFREECVPVCSPAIYARLRAEGFAAITLLQLPTRLQAWREWFEASGTDMDGINPLKGPRFELFSMAVGAAKAGLGLALVPHALVTDELANGSLRIAHPHPGPSRRAYYLVYPEANGTNPALKAFRDWLLRQAAPDQPLT